MSETTHSQRDDNDPTGASALGRILAAATRVPTSAPATIASWAETANDVVQAAKTNKQAVADLVRIEVERVVGALGLVTPTELVATQKRVSELERAVDRLTRRISVLEDQAAAESNAPTGTSAKKTAAKKTTAKKAAAKKTTAKKAAAKKTSAKKTAAKKTAAKKTAAKKSPTRAKARKVVADPPSNQD